MKITRKPWINILRAIIKLSPSSQTQVMFAKDWIIAAQPHFIVKLPYPPKNIVTPGNINAIHLLRALSPLSENIVEIDEWADQWHIREELVTIKIPFNHDALLPENTSSKVLKNAVVRELPLILKALKLVMGEVKSSGISEFLYWEKNKIYAFNGAVLAYADFAECPIGRILFPRNIAEFLIEIVSEAQVCSILVYADKTVECNFGELGSIRFSVPEVDLIDWKSLIPEMPEQWMGVPPALFRLPQIAMSLADRHHSKVKLKWQNKKLTIDNAEKSFLEFSLVNEMPTYANREGYVDVVALSPILNYAQQMAWANDCLIFKSHVFTFICMLEK